MPRYPALIGQLFFSKSIFENKTKYCGIEDGQGYDLNLAAGLKNNGYSQTTPEEISIFRIFRKCPTVFGLLFFLKSIFENKTKFCGREDGQDYNLNIAAGLRNNGYSQTTPEEISIFRIFRKCPTLIGLLFLLKFIFENKTKCCGIENGQGYHLNIATVLQNNG